METADPADEGEPSGKPIFIPFPILVALFLMSCRENSSKPAVKKIPLRTDTVKTVTAKPVIAKKPPQKKQRKKIYLTFDDGPNKGTKNVLDIVQQEEVPVSFFIVGEHVFASAAQAELWDSLLTAKNIEICNHSYTHAHNRYDQFYEKPETVVKDMERTRDSLLPETNIVRAPGRNSWRIDSLHYTDIKKSKAAMDSLQKAGFIVLGWDLEWHFDPKTYSVKNNSDEMLNQIDSVFNKGKTKRPDNLVLLAHDQAYRNSNDSTQLRDFIQKLKKKEEYELALVSTYPDIYKKLVDTVKIKTDMPVVDSN